MLGNEDLQPGGVPRVLLTDGKPPVFEIVDPLTVRYTWEKPNPDFLPQLAAPQAQTLLLPAHYLKQFHKKYQTKEKLQDLIVANKVKKWSALHIKMARSYRPENPALPTLDPWRNTTELPAEQFVFERNPFFHRVDKNGRQLPYIDQVILGVSSPTIIPAKCGAGESDLQFTNVDFSDYTFMKAAEHRHPVKVSLWKKTIGSRIAMMPNLNYTDPVWQKVLRDANVRRAISIAIDRHEINLAIFYGLGTESADTLLPSSPLYKREYANAWIQHDPAKADEMLDAAGLQNRDDDGIRFLPDGRRMEIVVETPGETTLDTDVLELVADHLEKVGLKVFRTRLAARYLPQPRARRANHDVGLVRPRQRHRHRGHEPRRYRAHHRGSIAVAPVGHPLHDERREGHRAGRARSRPADGPLQGLAILHDRSGAHGYLGQDADDLHPERVFDRLGQSDAPAGSRRQPAS